MKTLFYVPIIHSPADLGGLAKDVANRGVAGLGEAMWQEHLKTVQGFWNVLIQYFESFDAANVKIYQDGMMADGDTGRMIAEENAKAGSKNYELVLTMIKRGAILIKTEDISLVKAELANIISITREKSIIRKLFSYLRFILVKNRLLGKRDKFIAQRIAETLKDGEKGIIFIGAFHRIINLLPGDIQVKEIKNIDAIREYQKTLPFSGKSRKNKDKIAELSKYLLSKINQPET